MPSLHSEHSKLAVPKVCGTGGLRLAQNTRAAEFRKPIRQPYMLIRRILYKIYSMKGDEQTEHCLACIRFIFIFIDQKNFLSSQA